ncbi:signal peptide peptidase SppA [Altererythrobacter xixiisoli]|uniref:Signal peptide peptidase SppA n=1 Tax=Croceibacterium xixiisoli TaxID=1476466 RepID=A0A6I4TQD9_9SPHN|nr:signal peptide peptidase SppA [Croceibacterium xixiisoli]MXO98076.1 signal peptide peptidase SppA [Croceibacterium xixiisoli]
MAFAGKVWRLLVGIKDALALLFLLLFFAAIAAALSVRPSPAKVREGALLLQLDGSVVEEVANVDPLNALLSSAVPTRQYAARDLVRAIDKAAKDDRIKALALDLSTFLGGGQVHMQALGDALDRFRATKKPILTYGTALSDDAMLLAAHSTEVWVDPLGGVAIAGPGGKRMYYAGLLDKLKIRAKVYRVGTYKSAVEPYLLSGMSPEARENAQSLYGTLWDEWQADVKKARPKADIALVTGNVVEWLNASGGDVAQASVKAGLADRVGTRIEWGKRLAELVGKDDLDKSPGAFAATEIDPWLAAIGPGDDRSGAKKIGVITIAGEISDGEAGPGEAGAERIVALLDDALDDELAALVVRVDSPGGTVTGSEAIRRAILRHKDAKIPIVVSMANVAASGGYWVSTPADRIFAEPGTITGSIGIFGVVPTFQDALAEWGVTSDGVQTTPLSGQPDVAAGFTPETDAILQASVDSGYRRFLSLVAASRKVTPERADELGQGRVWDGGSARQLGLVDQFGSLNTALEWAAKQAKLKDDEWQTAYLSTAPDSNAMLLASLLGQNSARKAVGGDMFSRFADQQGALTAQAVSDLDRLFSSRGAMAHCLECPATPVRLSRGTARTEPQSGVWMMIREFLIG